MRWGGIALLIAAAALAPVSAAGEEASPPACRYVEAGPQGLRGNLLHVGEGDRDTAIFRVGAAIVVSGGGRGCEGALATVRNVDRIVVDAEGATLYVDERAGRFAPGATLEQGGSEIEIFVRGKRVEVDGSRGDDRMRASTLSGGRVGVDLNAPSEPTRGDVDLMLLDPSPEDLGLRGRGGGDLIDARGVGGQGGAASHRILRLYGGPGSDALLGSTWGDFLVDGRGDDLTRAGSGNDRVALARGRDLVQGGSGDDNVVYLGAGRDGSDTLFGGPGDDELSDLNETADALLCGRGVDTVTTDKVDGLVVGCERQR